MKIALLSDIHGNLIALNQVLDDLQQEAFDQILFLGDAAMFGPHPHEVIATLKRLDCPSIMGNVDEFALNPDPGEPSDENSQKLADIFLWCAQQLTVDDVNFIRGFCPTFKLDLSDNGSLLAFHGSPRSNREALLAGTPDEELENMFSGHSATILVGGHTHIQLLRRYGEITIVNPGSIGMPIIKSQGQMRHPPLAEYAILSWHNQRLEVTFKQVPVDMKELIGAANESDMPHVNWWLRNWIKGRH